MQASFTFTGTPETYIASREPDVPILFFDPAALHTRFALFQSGFPGLVTYAVKANDTSEVIENLHMAGLSNPAQPRPRAGGSRGAAGCLRDRRLRRAR